MLLGEKDPRWKICGVDVTLLELFRKESQEAKSRLSRYFLQYRMTVNLCKNNIPSANWCHPPQKFPHPLSPFTPSV